jgi:hypothetical protein
MRDGSWHAQHQDTPQRFWESSSELSEKIQSELTLGGGGGVKLTEHVTHQLLPSLINNTLNYNLMSL